MMRILDLHGPVQPNVFPKVGAARMDAAGDSKRKEVQQRRRLREQEALRSADSECKARYAWLLAAGKACSFCLPPLKKHEITGSQPPAYCVPRCAVHNHWTQCSEKLESSFAVLHRSSVLQLKSLAPSTF